MKGIDYPELQEEMFRLRVRKSELSELEDIIRRGEEKKPVSVEKLEQLFQNAVKQLDTELVFIGDLRV